MKTYSNLQHDRLQMALRYAQDGWPVIPLRGKKPLTTHGVKDATRDEAHIRQWWMQWPEANIGLATGTVSGRLVFDIDIKNGKRGDESLRALEEQFGSLPMTLKSQTASGGWHYVFQMPAVPVKSRNGVREGIDVLADGKYFVAPPSTIEGKPYRWVETGEEAPCPEWVAALGQQTSAPRDRPSAEDIPSRIRAWFPTGRESNGNWVTNCPYHEEDTPSFAVKLDDGVFICYACNARGSFVQLYATMMQVSEEAAQRALEPLPAFVEQLNRQHAVIMLGGRCVILNEERDPLHQWTSVSFSAPADFKQRYENHVVRLGGKRLPMGQAWLKHPNRREYQGLVFSPQQDVPGYYNLWQGFAVQPQAGNCDLMLDHIRMNICGGNPDLSQFVLAWMAQAVQAPAERPGTALVLRGKQGTGKGVLCVQFGSLFGPHFTHVTQSRHVAGHFNGHLKDALIVFADEAIWAGEKSSEGTLKALVTEEWLPIEYKGKDVVRVKNHVRLMIATNNDWPVPAGFEERRFCVIDVQETRMQDTAYFGALMAQWLSGGREAFLDYLLQYDCSGVNLRKIPNTAALMDIKLLTLKPAEQFWFNLLLRGGNDSDMIHWRPLIKRRSLHQMYLEFGKEIGETRRASETRLGQALRKLCPHLKDCREMVDRTTFERVWDVGTLEHCRAAFDRIMHWPNHDWSIPLDDASQKLEDDRAREEARRHAPKDEQDATAYPPIVDLEWSDFGPENEVEEEQVERKAWGSACTPPPPPEQAVAEELQGQSMDPPSCSGTRRIRSRCNRPSSSDHRPATGEEGDGAPAEPSSTPKKRGHATTSPRRRRKVAQP